MREVIQCDILFNVWMLRIVVCMTHITAMSNFSHYVHALNYLQ